MDHRERIMGLLYEAKKDEKLPISWKMNINTLHDLCVELDREEFYIEKGECVLRGYPIQLVRDATDIILETKL